MYSHYQVCFHKNKKSDEIMLPDDKKISKKLVWIALSYYANITYDKKHC